MVTYLFHKSDWFKQVWLDKLDLCRCLLGNIKFVSYIHFTEVMKMKLF